MGVWFGSSQSMLVAARNYEPLVVERQERLLWLCRVTALHRASRYGTTETVVALVKAGADVHCKDPLGYDSRGCILVSFFCHRA